MQYLLVRSFHLLLCGCVISFVWFFLVQITEALLWQTVNSTEFKVLNKTLTYSVSIFLSAKFVGFIYIWSQVRTYCIIVKLAVFVCQCQKKEGEVLHCTFT